MSRKEKVLGLFEFLMDLLEEPKVVSNEKEVVKEKNLFPHTTPINHNVIGNSLELMKKIEVIDKERAEEKMKARIIDNATKPFIKELEELKSNGIKNALEVKNDEELETIVSEVGDKMGITFEDGKVKLVNVPNQLRDNIPLNDEEIESLKIIDDLPKHIVEKLDETNLEVNATQETPIIIPKLKPTKPKVKKR